MLKLTYPVILLLLTNAVTAGDETKFNDTESSLVPIFIHDEEISPTVSEHSMTANNSPMHRNISDSSMLTESSDDLEGLEILALMKNHTPDDADEEGDADEAHDEKTKLFILYAELLSPFMKNPYSSHNEEKKEHFHEILTHMNENLKLIKPTERHELTQQLNILAVLKGELIYFQEKGKGSNKTREKITCTLADKFRIGKNRSHPMQMQCAQIEGGMLTAEKAALILFDTWEKEDVLAKRIKSCKRRLKSNGFHRYQHVDIELVDLLTIRAANPHVVQSSMYSENKIKSFCKRIRKNGKKKNQYIENIALLIAGEWRNQCILNEAIADCAQKTTEAKLLLEEIQLRRSLNRKI